MLEDLSKYIVSQEEIIKSIDAIVFAERWEKSVRRDIRSIMER